MFEPFHPKYISFLRAHQYLKPGDTNKDMEKMATKVYSGKASSYRMDRENNSIAYRGLLIKDIFANLFARWASVQFPNIKIILLVRNPFAVALSKFNKSLGYWLLDPIELLQQERLYEDYLCPFEDLIKAKSRKNDYILNQIVIWSIIHYVPIRQFPPNSIHVVFYEHVYKQPYNEIFRIQQFVNPANRQHPLTIDNHIIKQPSRVSGPESNIVLGNSPITSWKNKVNAKIIDEGFKILQAFGFEGLYDDVMPDRSVFTNIQKHTKI
jgi:hypothetical protein